MVKVHGLMRHEAETEKQKYFIGFDEPRKAGTVMTVKKMFKALIANGYLEKGTKLPDEEIRSLYDEMVADEANMASTEAESKVVPMAEEFCQLVALATKYDRTTDYIDNYKQQLQAEKRNDEIKAQFIEICTKLGYSISSNDFYKVINKTGMMHSTMSVEEAVKAMLLLTEKQYAEVTKEEEESTMTKKYTEAYMNVKTNEDKAQVLYLLVDTADGINNVHSDEYVKKDTLMDICKNLDIKVNRKTTRADAIVLIKHYADALSAKPKQKKKPAPKTTKAPKVSKSNTEAANKTKALLGLIKAHAIENQKKGYGYTVSAYMLCAYILQAGHGIMKLKGHEHEITPEQRESVKAVRKWLLDKGYIKECTYKADNNVIVYTEDYDGADSHKSRMVPISKAAGLKGIAVTSYKVTF